MIFVISHSNFDSLSDDKGRYGFCNVSFQFQGNKTGMVVYTFNIDIIEIIPTIFKLC